ncbi:MAG TPA: hypothetical protein VIN63_06060 [Candidatus Limnocylindria bacterium]|nr:hypothetical protein [Chloroflexota bacterium]
MKNQARRQEFRVVVDGVELPRDAVERLTRAIQKAAATELVALDLKGNFRFHIPPWNWGIWFGPLTEEQLKRAGIEKIDLPDMGTGS